MSADDLQGSGDAQAAPAATPPAGAAELSDERTLRYSPADQKTIQQPANTVPSVAKPVQPPRVSPGPALPASGTMTSSIAGELGPATLAPGLDLQDLSTERLLLSAKRMESHGRQCPSLKGIPLLAKIGQGGMGAVYYGLHPRLRSEVAVKVLPFQLAEQDPGTIRRFFREAQLAAAVHSPHLVNVTDVDEEAGLFFLIMEYVSGCSAGQYLKSVLGKGAPGLSEVDALDVTIAATEGLWAAHANNIVHRDIKPDNIMIPYLSRTTKELNLQSAKLMDLGLARNEDSQQSLTGNQSAMGTPGYMAPEQAMDAKSADKRSDVFSMGATLYALLCGHSPFKGETVMKVLMATMHEPHVPIKQVRTEVSQSVNDVVEKCLCKKPTSRYGDARQLLGALQDCRRLLTGGGTGEASLGFGSTLVYGGAKEGAKKLAVATTPGSSVEKTGIGLSASPQPAGSVPQPPPKPKKALVLVSVVLGVALLTGGVFFFARPRNRGAQPLEALKTVPQKTDVEILLADAGEKLAKYQLAEAESTLKEIERDYPNEKAIKDLRQKMEEEKLDVADVDRDLGIVQQTIKQARETADPGFLSAALRKINLARKMTPGYPAIVKIEKEYENAKLELTAKQDQANKLANFDKLVADIELRLKTGENLGFVKTELNSAKDLFPDNEKIKTLATALEEKEEKNKALTSAQRYITAALETGNLAGAEARLVEIRKIYPEDQKLKTLQDSLDTKKKADKEEFQRLIEDANKLIDAGNLSEVDKKIRDAANLFPDDLAIADVRTKLSKKRTAEDTEKAEKLERLAMIADINTALNADNLSDARKHLDAAGAKYKEDQEIAGLRAIYRQKQQQAEEQAKRKEFNGILTSVDELLKKKDADLSEIDNLVAQARQLLPNNEELVVREQQLKERHAEAQRQLEDQQKRTNFEGYMRAADEVLAQKDPDLDQAQSKLDLAKALFPEDAKLKQLLQDVETRRKDKIAQDIAAALAKGDLDAAGRQIAEAELNCPGEYLLRVKDELKQKKMAVEKERQRDTAFLNLTKAVGPTGTLADAQQQLAAFKANYPGDPEIPKFEVQLQKKVEQDREVKQKQKNFSDEIALADAAVQKGDYQAAYTHLDTAKGILADPAALNTVETKRAEYKRKSAADTEKAVRDALTKAEQALRTNPNDLAGAINSVQSVSAANPTNSELANVLKTLQDVQAKDKAIRQTVADASGKIEEFRKKDRLAKKGEFKQLTDARDRLQGLVPEASRDLAASSFKDPAAVLRKLEQNKVSFSDDINRLIEQLGKQPVRPDDDFTTDFHQPTKEKEPPKPPETKKKKDTGSAGELNTFDQ